ncbi:MAG TPA: baseplate J/gp47 family protein, partial [Verrucomicrobiota bacterium]|nr:baseplate J/gp47 family protein [Verrucomicrobiota bacterium]
TLLLVFTSESFDPRVVVPALLTNSAMSELGPFQLLLSAGKEMFEVPSSGIRLDLVTVTESGGGSPASIQVIAQLNPKAPLSEKAQADQLPEILQLDPKAAPFALQFTVELEVEAPAITSPEGQSQVSSPWPVLQLMLRDLPVAGVPTKRYEAFRSLALRNVELEVEVKGLANLTLQNELGVLDPKKPFEPFGPTPEVGSRFWLAHPELCAKRLDQLGLNLEWMGVPDNLVEHYGAWKGFSKGVAKITNNTSFTAGLQLQDHRRQQAVGEFRLFNAAPPPNPGVGNPYSLGASSPNQVSLSIPPNPAYHPLDAPIAGDEVLSWNRYWQIELLAPGFLHSEYSFALTQALLRKPDPVPLQPPYVPKIKRLTANYRSSIQIQPGSGESSQLFHVGPFGVASLKADRAGRYCLFGQFETAGELYLGLAGLTPPRNVALLFQVAEGSADPDLAPQAVRWSYLSANQWVSLEQGGILSDGTNGLLNTGIIVFDLGAVEASTWLPAGYYWIRATVEGNPRSIGDLVDVRAQAVRATFVDRGNDPAFLDHPLSAGAITGLAESVAEIQSVSQPFTSRGGTGPEQDRRFYLRVSERLRHKNRAVTCWDYERLILQSFPEVYKVKCLPVGSSERPAQAAAIQIIVIPNIRGKLPFDPFEPKLPSDTLKAIEGYLRQLSPTWAEFTVRNPRYLQLKLKFSVRFQPGCNPGYYVQVLERDLQHHLAPWAYDRSADIVFSGRVNANLLVDFIEERPYVDFLAAIRLFTSQNGVDFRELPSGEWDLSMIPGGGPDAILVSAREHDIELIGSERYVEQHFFGINHMKIELDFAIA